MRTLVLTIEIPESDGEEFSAHLVGPVDPEELAPALIVAADAVVYSATLAAMTSADPHMNGDLIRRLASLETRAELLHQITHLPRPSDDGMVGVI